VDAEDMSSMSFGQRESARQYGADYGVAWQKFLATPDIEID
jgi:hypothetical protein